MQDNEVYTAIGDKGFRRLVAAFYKQVPADDILGPMYPADDLAGAEDRLCSFLIYRFGGPPAYLEQRGHPRLRMRHAPFAINQAARDRWVQLMSKALAEAKLPADAESHLREFLGSFASFMMNQ
jgi:hemoglobin